jgi:outer membrane protein assembly factor BamB
MLRIRVGASWKDDPELRVALARGRAAAAHVIDAIAIEVDGVDLGAGRAEGEVLAAVEELVHAAARLVAGGHRAAVHFADGGLELLLRRRGGSALLTLVALERPSRVVASEVEVELPALARAAREAGEALLADLAALGGPASDWGAGVEQALSRLAAARHAGDAERPPPPGVRPPPRRPRRDAPSCGFELRDDEGLLGSYDGVGADLGSLLAPGRVWIRAPGGDEVLTLDGAPFLVLRDLAAFGERIAAARRTRAPRAEATLAARGSRRVRLVVDLAAGTLAAGGPPQRCAALPLARALLEAALDLCGAAIARHPAQARNPYVAELRRAAAGALEHVAELAAGDRTREGGAAVRSRRRTLPRAPLAPGRMRRIAFRRAWSADVGPPAGEGLWRAADLVVAAGETAVAALDAGTGAERWRAAGARWAARAGDLLCAARGGAVACHDLATGRERWSRQLAGGLPRALTAPGAGRPLVLAAGPALFALDPASGRILWRFEPPAARALQLAAFGPLALAASDAGFLYALDASGRLEWRLHLPGPPTGPPQPLGSDGAVLCATDRGGALVRFDAASGRRRFEAPLEFTPTAPAVPFAGLLGVCGAVAGDPVVAAVDSAGALAWTDAAPLAGPLAGAEVPIGLLVKTAGGACAALGRDGEVRWAGGGDSRHPPPSNLAPVAARGVALVPGETVAVLDPASGGHLGEAPVGAAARLLVDPDLSLYAIDADGLVLAARVATHLSVL